MEASRETFAVLKHYLIGIKAAPPKAFPSQRHAVIHAPFFTLVNTEDFRLADWSAVEHLSHDSFAGIDLSHSQWMTRQSWEANQTILQSINLMSWSTCKLRLWCKSIMATLQDSMSDLSHLQSAKRRMLIARLEINSIGTFWVLAGGNQGKSNLWVIHMYHETSADLVALPDLWLTASLNIGQHYCRARTGVGCLMYAKTHTNQLNSRFFDAHLHLQVFNNLILTFLSAVNVLPQRDKIIKATILTNWEQYKPRHMSWLYIHIQQSECTSKTSLRLIGQCSKLCRLAQCLV